MIDLEASIQRGLGGYCSLKLNEVESQLGQESHVLGSGDEPPVEYMTNPQSSHSTY